LPHAADWKCVASVIPCYQTWAVQRNVWRQATGSKPETHQQEASPFVFLYHNGESARKNTACLEFNYLPFALGFESVGPQVCHMRHSAQRGLQSSAADLESATIAVKTKPFPSKQDKKIKTIHSQTLIQRVNKDNNLRISVMEAAIDELLVAMDGPNTSHGQADLTNMIEKCFFNDRELINIEGRAILGDL
jgi:hypothetical protein